MNKRIVFLLVVLAAVAFKFLLKYENYVEATSYVIENRGFGQNNSLSKIRKIDLSFEQDFYEKIGHVIRYRDNIATSARVGVYFPKNYDPSETVPLFWAMNPGSGASLGAIYQYTRFADKLGFAVATIELSREVDSEDSRLYYILKSIDKLTGEGVLGDDPVFIGGFSGGGKWALHLGAWAGDYLTGMMGMGTNEDLASFGYYQTYNDTCFDVPILMLTGTNDSIAGTNDYNFYGMFWRMKETGFKKVKTMIYDGGHSLPYDETLEAFEYMLDNATQRRWI